ncbi:MOS1T transposase, partial [Pseudoatta argentina]
AKMSIQSPAKCEIRSVIRYLVWKGKTPVEVYNEVKTAYGDKGMNRTSVFKWCREFKNGRTSVHDDQRSGRPSILTDDIVENIENALRDDRRLPVDELSAMFPQIARSLLRETITETLGYRKLSARWVPKQLTDQHKDWFRRFKNNDFQLEDKERSGAPKKFQELGKILQVDESTVSKRLKGLGMIQKQGHWVPYELLLLCIWWDQQGVIHGGSLSTSIDAFDSSLKRKRHDKVILLHDNARPHVVKRVKTYLETLKWEVLPHPPYSPDIAPSNFHLFRSITHGLADRRFHSYEEAQKWIDSWIASTDMSFFRRGIHVLPERWEKKSAAEAHRILVQTYGDLDALRVAWQQHVSSPCTARRHDVKNTKTETEPSDGDRTFTVHLPRATALNANEENTREKRTHARACTSCRGAHAPNYSARSRNDGGGGDDDSTTATGGLYAFTCQDASAFTPYAGTLVRLVFCHPPLGTRLFQSSPRCPLGDRPVSLLLSALPLTILTPQPPPSLGGKQSTAAHEALYEYEAEESTHACYIGKRIAALESPKIIICVMIIIRPIRTMLLTINIMEILADNIIASHAAQ